MGHNNKCCPGKAKYLSGKRILPEAISKNSSIVSVIDNLDAYNGGRLRAACHLMRDRYSKDEVTVSYTLGLPPIATGVFALQDVRLSAGLSLPFKSDKSARLRFDFSERHHPFLLTVSMFAGGGYLGIELKPDGIKTIDGALEFGGNMALNLGVASGGVYVMGGIYYKRDISTLDNKVILEGYLRCGGCLVVLGIVSVCVEFRLGLNYDVRTNKVWGAATLTVEVETLFFSKTVNLKLERTFAGAGRDPTFKLERTFAGAGSAPTFSDQVPSINVWKEYA
ncbi:MAG TPA: hypothetical protein PK599_04220, partial [bacterium]|nr:hypothetical protein [bacterium]